MQAEVHKFLQSWVVKAGAVLTGAMLTGAVLRGGLKTRPRLGMALSLRLFFKRMTQVYGILILMLSLVACNAGRDRTNVELIQGMMDQPSLKAQDWDVKRNKPAVRVPPEGTKPMGQSVYKHSFESAAGLKNPLPLNLDTLASGKKAFTLYCQVCHGPSGRGDGRIASKLSVVVADLQSERVKNEYTSGQLFHVITEGYGQMRGYKSIITNEQDRWAIVHYVQHLNK